MRAMLVIRRHQMASLGEPRMQRFAAELGARLSRRFPERFPDAAAPSTAAFVERAIREALAHGIATEDAVASLAGLRAAYGERFEWTPVAAQARALLDDATLPGAIKIAAIERCLFDATGGRPVTVVADDGAARAEED